LAGVPDEEPSTARLSRFGYLGISSAILGDIRLISRNIRILRVAKFIQTLDPDVYRKVKETAKRRGQSVQELIRSVVAEWLEARR